MVKLNISRLKTFKRRRRGCKFNNHFFDKGIESAQHAWMLGWAYGDGSVIAHYHDIPDRFDISLQFGDIDVLDKLNATNMLSGEAGITIGWKPSSTMKSRPQCRMSFYNSHFGASLNNLGCIPNKCNMIAFPHHIVPRQYMRDFIRGYIEADASLTIRSDGATGIHFEATCFEFLNDLNATIASLAGVCASSIAPRNKGIGKQQYHMYWYSRHSVAQILTLIYGDVDASICMNRKHNRSNFIIDMTKLSRNERMEHIDTFKQSERVNEYNTLCSLIDMATKASLHGSRRYQYTFAKSFVSFLEQFTVDADGNLHHDWKERVWKKVGEFRR